MRVTKFQATWYQRRFVLAFVNDYISNFCTCAGTHDTFVTIVYVNKLHYGGKTLKININGRDVQRKNVVNNVDKSGLWAP